MNPTSADVAELRRQAQVARTSRGTEWEGSRRLVAPERLPTTLQKLQDAVADSPWPVSLKEALTQALGTSGLAHGQDVAGEPLKQLIGLPPTKAIRALCVLLNLVPPEAVPVADSFLSPPAIEDFVRSHDNPFDLLPASPAASLLDLGAGDLSFAEELAIRYGPPLAQRGLRLILHCIDRLDPASRLGGPLHPEAGRLERLRANPYLQFHYFGDRDMFDFDKSDSSYGLAPRYGIVSCWAPATPTFAYEPSRIAPKIIQDDLRRTKGAFRTVRLENGEAALEVQHQGRSLLFPPWKFDIRGPRSLLHLMARRGACCVLGAVDSQVFWELLAQLVEDPRVRPPDRLFTEETLPETFGDIHRTLSQLPVGRSLDLADVAELRRSIPGPLSTGRDVEQPLRFRYVQIRRGAVFPGIPVSSTAKLFGHMVEERPPWFITLVPEPAVGTEHDAAYAPSESH